MQVHRYIPDAHVTRLRPFSLSRLHRPDESTSTTPFHDQMSPPRPRPRLSTGGRSPLAEVTEDRRLSSNSTPLSHHGSPLAAGRKKEAEKGAEEEEEDGKGDKVCNDSWFWLLVMVVI